MEETVAPLLKKYHIKTAYVYNALAARADLHAGLVPLDCTHFGTDALIYLNEQVLKTLANDIR